MKKRVLSVFIAILFILNCFPISVLAADTEENDFIEVKFDEKYAEEFIFYYNSENKMEVDCSEATLEEKKDSDNVYLIAKVFKIDYEEQEVTVNNFSLSGNDAEKYHLTDAPDEYTMDLPTEVTVTPNEESIYYGQKIPEFTYSVEPSGLEDVRLTVGIAADKEALMEGNYNYTVKSNDPNYIAKIADNCKFRVERYIPEESFWLKENTYILEKENKTVLTAPNGFDISLDRTEFDKDVEVELEETNIGEKKSLTYYLKNNNEGDAEGAVSEKLEHYYCCSVSPPEIVSAEVECAVPDSILQTKAFGVISNNSVVLKITARGTGVDQKTKIYLEDNNGSVKTCCAEKCDEIDGKYYYSAKFTIDLPESKYLTSHFKASASNESGKSEPRDGWLKLGKDDNNNDIETLILDKLPPKAESMTINYNNEEKYFEVKGTIKDSESGIDKIEYKWSFDTLENFLEYGKNSGGYEENNKSDKFTYDHSPCKDIEFNVKVNYNDVPSTEYPYKLNLKVTDNAGNVYEELFEFIDAEQGRDTKSPEIYSIGFCDEGSEEFINSIKFLSFGNYANDNIELVVKAYDTSDTTYVSGIDWIFLCDMFDEGQIYRIAPNPDKSERIYVEEELDIKELYKYVFDIPKGTKLDNMSIQLKDKCNKPKNVDVNKLIGEMTKNSLVVENNSPNIEFIVSNSLNDSRSVNDEDFIYNSDKKIWYNETDGEKSCSGYEGNFVIFVNDETEDGIYSGINNVTISEIDGDGNAVEIMNKGFDSFDPKYSYSLMSSQLEDGEHRYIVTVSDNAGNTKTVEQSIYVDKEKPHGDICIESPEAVEVDGRKWFDKDKVIEFRIDAEPDVSGIENIELWINGIEKNFSADDIQTTEDGYAVIVDTGDINFDNEHNYTVTGNITDFAGNRSYMAPLTVYVDCEPPVISKFTVEKKSKALSKVLNVLSFGAYSNDSLIFKAYVSDGEFDSGIQCVKIEYEGSDGVHDMTDEGNGIYSYELSSEIEIFQSDIQVTAYDNCNKESLNCPNIENAEQGKGVSNNVFAMIETKKPTVAIRKPKGSGVVTVDGQTWFNANKSIAIFAYDKESGIRNVDIKINGIDVEYDKNKVIIPKTEITASAETRDSQRRRYDFDTDYFTEIADKPEDGEYTITVKAIDNAGNVNSKGRYTYHVDEISPTIDRIEFVPETSNNVNGTSEYIEYLEYGYYFKKDFIANVHVTDGAPSSGLNRIEYRLVTYDNGEIKEETTGEKIISDGIAPIDIPAGFKGQIFVKAIDNVGNTSDEETPRAFVADDVAPGIKISGIGDSRYYDAKGNKLFTNDVNVTVTITDKKSGIGSVGSYINSENGGYERRGITIGGTNISEGDELGDGWIVSETDANLVTEIAKTFIFDKDDNDITLTFDAADNSGNVVGFIQSETFTIDKTAPVINADISAGINNTIYYNAENRAVLTIDVIERNFDPGLIQATIENTFNGNIPYISFQDLSATEHRAVITFSEGDYTFDIRGADLGGHSAEVNLDYEKVRRFFVDETAPLVEENFSDFVNRDKDNYLNTKKTAVIKITEHNFDPDLVGLKILRKDAGTEHSENEFTDVTYSVASMSDWSDNNDTHTLSVEFDEDAVYRIEIYPSDPSGNTSEYRSSEIFEIDTTLPVASAKNGSLVDDNNAVEFLDIYPYSRKDEDAPTVEFTDVNFDYIKYSLTVYTPEYKNGRELSEVKPVNVYLDSDKEKSGIFRKEMFTLPDFKKDGVYALELIAVDKAGNESVLNSNTYMRIVDSDVLAYISNSSAANKTGWYSFQYENGDTISKRPDNFSDIDIVVLAKNNSDIDIVLRDYNGDEKNTELQAEADSDMYGVSVYRYTLKSDYFKDNFQGDTDVELYLSVKNENGRIDLGKMHIDNIPPSCTLPGDLKSWNWYFGNDSRTITITDISELLDKTKCKVYDDGKEIDFIYSETDGSISFTLDSGWHNVGITLEDVAGNTYSIQEVDNIHIGYFWLWIIIISSVIFVGIIILIIYIVRKRRYS